MTKGLEGWYGGNDLHSITCGCYQRRPELGSDQRRDLFLRGLERARQDYRFVVTGCYSAERSHSFENRE
jgi:hypothetical protein